MICCAPDHEAAISSCLDMAAAEGRLDRLVAILCKEGGVSCAREILAALQLMHDCHCHEDASSEKRKSVEGWPALHDDGRPSSDELSRQLIHDGSCSLASPLQEESGGKTDRGEEAGLPHDDDSRSLHGRVSDHEDKAESAAAASASNSSIDNCTALWEPHCKAAHDMAWEKLHTGPWRDVKLVWRDLFSLASLLLALSIRLHGRSHDAMKALDMGILMGGPSYRRDLDSEIAQLQEQEQHSEVRRAAAGDVTEQLVQDALLSHGASEQEMEEEESGRCRTTGHSDEECIRLPSQNRGDLKVVRPPPGERAEKRPRMTLLSEEEVETADLPRGSFQGTAVETRELPSLEDFFCRFMLVARPVVIKDAIGHWPAMSRWCDLSYLKRVAGARTVPVEVGQHYLAESWRQDLMTLEEFIDRHMAPSTCATSSSAGGESVAMSEGAVRCERGYLAQHQLFDQVPSLRKDIAVPEYCAFGGGDMQSINAWFGPRGTVTPIHHDPHHNLLCQVVGRKYVRLFSAEEDERMYPHPEGMLHNSSQVDIDAMDSGKWPLFGDVPYFECVLTEGDMLYIPPKWWHYVRALTPSFSVSFWWAVAASEDDDVDA